MLSLPSPDNAPAWIEVNAKPWTLIDSTSPHGRPQSSDRARMSSRSFSRSAATMRSPRVASETSFAVLVCVGPEGDVGLVELGAIVARGQGGSLYLLQVVELDDNVSGEWQRRAAGARWQSLREVAHERPNALQVLDFAGHLREWPGGLFDPELRPDGIHLSNQAAVLVGKQWLGPEILRAIQTEPRSEEVTP